MTVISDVCFVIFNSLFSLSFLVGTLLPLHGLLLNLKLARVDVGNVNKKGENMEGLIT